MGSATIEELAGYLETEYGLVIPDTDGLEVRIKKVVAQNEYMKFGNELKKVYFDKADYYDDINNYN